MNPRKKAGFLAAAGVLTVSLGALCADAPPIVRVYVAGSAEAVSGSRDAIQDLCSRSNVAVVVRDAAGADEALLSTSRAPGLADAYVDLRPGTAPRVVVVDGETRQDLERRTLAEGASLEISIETMAQVVCAAVESSLAARAAAAAKVAPPPKVEEPSKAKTVEEPAEHSRHWQTRASLLASGSDFGNGFRAGVGAGFGLNYGHATWHFGGIFSVIGYPAAGVENTEGLASVGLVGLRALPLLEWQVAPAVTTFAGVGGGLDWIQISGERPPPGAVASPTERVFEPVASGMLGLRLALGRSVSALFAFDTDVVLVRHSYVVQTPDGGTAPFFEPPRVRPMALAGVSLSLGGGSEPPASRAEARR
ncbi:MAG TPA: hypothetical protein VER96_25305 [Polyangiaceae bacterium]|nr:hypothetical protein [Polyangiaceae bacterium]